MDKPVSFSSGGIRLEGRFDRALDITARRNGVVITHPHPQNGGSMDSPVVQTMAGVYSTMGFSTLVFNFRGVGESQGRYDNGEGEQQDVAAALTFLLNEGMEILHLSGYSFGAWVNAGMDSGAFNLKQMIMVSPPVAALNFSAVRSIGCPLGIITGDNDEISPPDQVSAMAKEWQTDARIRVINGADHFYSGAVPALIRTLMEIIQT